ncbi:recombinase family protein [Bradyrhizobium sp. 197]|uniref:recombinase family protein n=1 Tax=Bradyrhizobium sp. 197 TaxID=2782663 RepID=UPI001FF9012A|nr:recombinase family protein [Bradyrhizobium sp. 197]MCK1480471.1 recombinase family protein [Bradyrhizobium sp. 197]
MTKPTPILRTALYARYSSDLQKDTSIEDQFAMLEKAAKRLNLKLDPRHYYADRAQSATTLFDRPGLTRDLLGAASRHEFDAVLVEATDRLSRSQADLFWLSDRFNFGNVKLFTQSGEVSDMQLTFDSHSNADYIKKLAMRVRRGHDRAVENGRFVTPPAYGYDAVPGKAGERVINEKEAATVRRIFAEYAVGKTPRQIVAGLAHDGIPSPSGAPFWSHQSIVGGLGKSAGLIRNRLYIGEYVKNQFFNVKNPSTGKRVKRKADEADLIVISKPGLALIPRELWDAAHAIRTKRALKRLPSSGYQQRAVIPRKEHLLSGLTRCAACGGQMTVVATPQSGKRVGCSSAIYRKTCDNTKSYNLNSLTQLAVERMHSQLTDPEFIKEQAKAKAAEFARLSKQDSEDRQHTQKQLDRLNVQIKRLADAVAESDVPVKELMEMIKTKEIERAALQERSRLLGVQSNITAIHPTALTAFGRNIETLHAKLKRNPDDPECRLAFANIMDSVLVHPTAKGAPYEISLYARLSAIMGGVDLFPSKRSAQEVVAAEGLPRDGLGGTALSRRRSSRPFTGW